MFGETITVHPGDTIDRNNDRVPATGNPFPVDGCAVDFLGSEETLVRGRNGVFTKIRVHITTTPERPIGRTDDIEVRGLRYMVAGETFAWKDPFDDEIEFPDEPDTVGTSVVGYRAEG